MLVMGEKVPEGSFFFKNKSGTWHAHYTGTGKRPLGDHFALYKFRVVAGINDLLLETSKVYSGFLNDVVYFS